jgi:hypothetical protein
MVFRGWTLAGMSAGLFAPILLHKMALANRAVAPRRSLTTFASRSQRSCLLTFSRERPT